MKDLKNSIMRAGVLASLQECNDGETDTIITSFNSKNTMNSATNITLLTVGTGLISLGSTAISAHLLAGVVEILLGIVLYGIYEFTPSKS